MEYPRVLVLDHSAFHEKKNNGKTKSALFEGYPKEKLAQFYISNELPSYAVCNNFFRITEYDILNANIKFKKASGFILNDQCDEANESASLKLVNPNEIKGLHRFIYKGMENRMPILELAREIAWRKSKWQTSEFIQWLDDFNPQIIFTLGSYCPFFHKIIHWVQQRYNTQIFLFTTDDYTFVRSTLSPIAWLNHFRYMHWLRKTLAKSKKLYTISPAMKKEYADRFKLSNVGLLANSVEVYEETSEPVQVPDKSLRLVYAGGMHFNRWKVLSWLGECLDNLKKEGFNGVLDIYCPIPPSNEIIEELTKSACVSYKGSLNPDELYVEISKSNVLVHVEAFDRDSAKATRLSLSTKIPEYMISNRCILAIGPDSVASMQYLKENNIALCVNSMEKADMQMIKQHLFDMNFREKMANNARKVAIQNHSLIKIQQEFYNDLISSQMEE